MDDYFEPLSSERWAELEKRLASLDTEAKRAKFRERVQPLTPADQWEKVARWRKHLADARADEQPELHALAGAWQRLPHEEAEMLFGYRDGSAFSELLGEDLPPDRATPLETLFEFVGRGLYPPPELLATLRDAWLHYLFRDGDISLEEAFMGPPVPKAGNGARRINARFAHREDSDEMRQLLSEGYSRTEAAKRIAKRTGKYFETVLRTVNPFGFNRREPEK